MVYTFVGSIKKCHRLSRADQSKLTSWLCEKMVHSKCAGYTCRPDDLAKGHNLLFCCDPCLEVAQEIRSFMRQTKDGLKGIFNSFGIARDSFRQADELLSALDSQFNSR